MTIQEVQNQLAAKADPKMRAINVKRGAPDNHLGVKNGDLRTLAKEIKSDHALGLQLWKSGQFDAMMLATLILKPKQLSADEVEAMVDDLTCDQLADWLTTHVIKTHPAKEQLRLRWLQDDAPYRARAGWSLTSERIQKSPEGLDLVGILDRLEKEMLAASREAQWTMNYCLAEIGICFPEHRDRAIALGEKLGLYRDWPVSKGCVSPFAPIWIGEMVKRGS